MRIQVNSAIDAILFENAIDALKFCFSEEVKGFKVKAYMEDGQELSRSELIDEAKRDVTIAATPGHGLV